jgi:hypothetical protein
VIGTRFKSTLCVRVVRLIIPCYGSFHLTYDPEYSEEHGIVYAQDYLQDALKILDPMPESERKKKWKGVVENLLQLSNTEELIEIPNPGAPSSE